MAVRVSGSPNEIRLNLDEALREAMAEWSAAIPGLTFSEQAYYSGNSKKWYFDLDEDSPSQNKTANALRYVEGSNHNATITFFSRGFERLTAPNVYGALSTTMSAPTMRKYLEFVLRYTAKHEIGHLLGFEHTPGPDVTQTTDNGECAAIVWFNDFPNVTPGPPLMIETLTEYFAIMRTYHGVPLGINDINIAPQEAAYARAMFNVDCPVTPQGATGAPNTNTCPVPLRIVNNAQAAEYLLLD